MKINKINSNTTNTDWLFTVMNQNQLDGALEKETVAIAYYLQSLGLKTVISLVFSGYM